MKKYIQKIVLNFLDIESKVVELVDQHTSTLSDAVESAVGEELDNRLSSAIEEGIADYDFSDTVDTIFDDKVSNLDVSDMDGFITACRSNDIPDMDEVREEISNQLEDVEMDGYIKTEDAEYLVTEMYKKNIYDSPVFEKLVEDAVNRKLSEITFNACITAVIK